MLSVIPSYCGVYQRKLKEILVTIEQHKMEGTFFFVCPTYEDWHKVCSKKRQTHTLENSMQS